MMPTQAAFDAFQRGDIALEDFFSERHDPMWGTSVYKRSGHYALYMSTTIGKAAVSQPSLDDEHISRRVAIPESVQEIAGVSHDVAVVRTATLKKIEDKHGNAVSVFDGISELLDNWIVMVPRHPRSSRWAIFSRHDERWVTSAIGPIQRGPGKGITELVSFYIAEDTDWIFRQWDTSGVVWRNPDEESIWRAQLERQRKRK